MIDLVMDTTTKYDRFVVFLKWAVDQCKDGNSTDRQYTCIGYTELREFCKSAYEIGLPVYYVCEDCISTHQTMDALTRYEDMR